MILNRVTPGVKNWRKEERKSWEHWGEGTSASPRGNSTGKSPEWGQGDTQQGHRGSWCGSSGG